LPDSPTVLLQSASVKPQSLHPTKLKPPIGLPLSGQAYGTFIGEKGDTPWKSKGTPVIFFGSSHREVGTLQKKLLKPPLDFSTPALPLFFVQESEVSLSCYSNWAMKMTPHILTNLVF
jgi:hypothetical protein